MSAPTERELARTNIAENRKAFHDYHVLDRLEAGLVLTGTEVKALRAGRASLVDGFAQAAHRMAEAGADGVEIVASHGYLPAQFMNPRVNRRADSMAARWTIACALCASPFRRSAPRCPWCLSRSWERERPWRRGAPSSGPSR